MSISDVDIANRALSKLGEPRVLSFTAIGDTNAAQRALASMYDMVRDAELCRHPWAFAVCRAQIDKLTSAPAWGYSYEYQLPNDHLRLLDIRDTWESTNSINYITDPNSPYRVEKGKILIDIDATIYIRYISRITDPSQFDPLFAEAFASRLAVELAETLTQSNTKKDFAEKQYAKDIIAAFQRNAIEMPPEALADDSWILGRR